MTSHACLRLHRALSAHAPRFALRPADARRVDSPRDFFAQMLARVRRAERRVTLSSLYLGGGADSAALIDAIREAKRARPNLQITLLFDLLRAARRDSPALPTTVEQVRPLLADVGSFGANFYLHHNVNATGLAERFLAPRWNELPGVHHMKLYIVDDDVCLSGANLSESYFSDRRDRYWWLAPAPALADHYSALLARVILPHSHRVLLPPAVSSARVRTHSELESAFGVVLEPPAARVSAVDAPTQFRDSLRAALVQFHGDEMARTANVDLSSSDTWLYPSLQLGCVDFHQDRRLLEALLDSFEPDSHTTLTSPYLNLTPDLQRRLLADRAQSLALLTASPRANGFFTAKGASRRVPAAYVLLERQFWDAAERAQKRFSLHEYARKGWTYHGKGLWYTPPNERLPSLTLIGSANFGARSLMRDTEAQVTLVTDNVALRQQLADEQQLLLDDSVRVPDRRYLVEEADHVVPFWVHCATRIARDVF
jgi:CDP-diacylglycerol--glycerol-3-phosphate 3-phosphatidyltransferase